MTNVRLEVLPDRAAIVERSLSLVLEKARAAIAENGRFTIVLAGGSTPKPLYEAIATQSLPWEKIHVFWGDERYVSPDRPESNQRMAREAWLDRVPVPAANLHPIPTDAGDPAADARAYDRHIDEFFQGLPDASTAFDLVLLGMGDDGHTASLFPHTAALKVNDARATVGSKNGEAPYHPDGASTAAIALRYLSRFGREQVPCPQQSFRSQHRPGSLSGKIRPTRRRTVVAGRRARRRRLAGKSPLAGLSIPPPIVRSQPFEWERDMIVCPNCGTPKP